MQSAHEMGQAVTAIEREGTAARTLGTFSGGNPYLQRERFAGSSNSAEAEWLRQCNAWWRGWDLEDARHRSAECGAWPRFAGSGVHSM